MTTQHRTATQTCLDCKVLPPFVIIFCPLHANAHAMLGLIQDIAFAQRVNRDRYKQWTAEARTLLDKIQKAA